MVLLSEAEWQAMQTLPQEQSDQSLPSLDLSQN